MDFTSFIRNFLEQFEDPDSIVLNEETKFRELNGWSSLVAFSVMAMADEEYGVIISANDITGISTIKDLFEMINSRIQ